MRAPADPGPRRLLLAAGITAVLVLLAGLSGVGMWATGIDRVTADEPQYLLTAVSLATDGDLDIADELAGEVWRDFHASQLPRQTQPRADGSELSPHNPLLPVLLVVPVLLADTLGAPAWAAAKAALGVCAAILAGLLVWTAGRRLRVPPVTAAVVVTAFCASPPLSVYATQLYPEVPAALCATLVVAALTAPQLRPAHLLVGAAAVVALPWFAVKYAAVAAVAAGWLLWRVRGRRLLVVSAGLLLSGVGYLTFNRAVYGGWTPYAAGDHFVGGELTAVGVGPDYLGRTQRLLGLLVDRDFGLVPWQPAWLLAVVAVAWAVTRRRQGGGEAARRYVPLLALVAAGWATATWVALTMHGWWWPGRQVVVVLPLPVLLVAAWAGGHPRRLAAVLVLGSAGMVAHGALVWGTSGTDRRHSLVVDFTETTAPGYQLLRPLFPALSEPTSNTGALLAAWLVVIVAAGAVGVRHARGGVSRRPAPHPTAPPPRSPAR